MAISIPLRAERIHPRRRALLVAGALAAGVVVTLAAQRLSHAAVFDVRDVAVRGTAHLTPADVVGLAAIEPGTSVVWLDEAAVAERIERHPWVADATVTTSLPGGLRISVVEREAVAIAVVDGTETLVAADGTLLAAAPAGVPLVRFEDRSGTARFAGAAAAIGPLAPRVLRSVDRVIVTAGGTLELRLDDGTLVRYGAPRDLGAKADALARVVTWLEREAIGVARVSVVAPSNPAITPI